MTFRVVTFLLCLPALFAQVRITRHIDNQRRVSLSENRHPLARAENETGTPDPDLPMERMVLVLASDDSQQQELETLLNAQHDPSSPLYRQWLTPEEFGRRFGISAEDLAQVRGWLESQGFTVEEIPQGNRAVVFSGTVSQVSSAFHTRFRHYRVKGRTYVANAAGLEIPEALSGVVRGISTLHNFGRDAMNAGRIEPQLTATSGAHYLSPADFATIYDVNPLYSSSIDGTGQTIAVVARCNINISDVTKFRSVMGLPANSPAIVVNGTDPGVYNQNEALEALLDVEWAGAIARKATVKMVVSKSSNTTDGVDLSAQYIVSNNLASVMTASFGNCEGYLGTAENLFWNNLYQQAAAQGITAFVASGDSGAAGCDSVSSSTATLGRAVNGLASTPYNVAVGGTQFVDAQNPGLYWLGATNMTNYSSVLSYMPEAAWNESGAAGGSGLWSTGGGASIVYVKPSWQTGSGVPADGMRDVPDVALSAAGHDAYLLVQNGNLYAVSGTSASAPVFASLMALVNQQTNARQGNANTRLYALAAEQPAVFHDITSGNNSVPGVTGFNAGAGFDLATGLGSVDAYLLATRWTGTAPSPDFQIAPASNALSVQAGSAAAVKLNLTVSNGFNSALNLSVGTLPAGVTASLAPAALAAPGSGSSTLTLTATSTAAPGTYSVVVTAAGGTVTHTATLSLTITSSADFNISATSAAVSVNAGATAATPVTITVSGGFSAAIALTATNLPPGLTASFSPATLAAPGSGTSTLTLTAASSTAGGSYSVTLIAAAGSLTKTATLGVKVVAPASLGFSADTARLAVNAGGAMSTRVITTALNGFNSAVAFSAKGMPTGLMAAFAPATIAAPGSGASILTFTAGSTTTPGTYNVVITATGGSLAPAVTLQVTVVSVPAFALTTNAAALSIEQGASGNLTVTTTVSGGFQSAVSFSVLGLFPGMTASFSPANLASPGAGSSTLTINTSASTVPQTGTLYVLATGAGVTKLALVTVTVTGRPVSVVPAGNAVYLGRGGSLALGLTVKIASSVTVPVKLSLTGAPSGLTGVFTPASFSGAGTYTGILKLSAGSSMARGNWTVSISATAGTSVFTYPISVTVQ